MYTFVLVELGLFFFYIKPKYDASRWVVKSKQKTPSKMLLVAAFDEDLSTYRKNERIQ